MTEPGLRLDRLTRRPGVIDLLDRIDPSGAVSVLATGGKVVRGGATGPGAGASVPILVGGIEVGSVAGEGDRVSLVAEVLERLGEAEVERRAMAINCTTGTFCGEIEVAGSRINVTGRLDAASRRLRIH